MLELQRPQPMPHAVGADSTLNPLAQPTKLQRSLPPLSRRESAFPLRSLENHLNSLPPLAPPKSVLPTPPSGPAFEQKGGEHMQSSAKAMDYAWGRRDLVTPQKNSYPDSTALQNAHNTSSRPFSGARSPTSQQQSSQEQGHRRKTSTNNIAPNLQTPESINAPQAGLPQLAAEITCLFWFEKSSLLQDILKSSSPGLKASIIPEAVPTTGFRKWVATILSTTQVAQNVILLALLFIWRLKKINPSVQGRPGSEYRLLTVALMLGNKFLDDNTYTNKTWAEVSGISVQEVHIMEVEFLSNMKYNLFTSLAEWKEWHTILGKFGSFFEQALRRHFDASTPMSLGPVTPTLQVPPPLPSPPASNYTSPGYSTAGQTTPHHPFSHTTPTPLLLPQVSSATVSPIGPLPEVDARLNPRKRSIDENQYEPPPKRQTLPFPPALPSTTTAHRSVPSNAPALPRMQLPSLSIPVSHNLEAPLQPLAHLPPPGGKAMSLVFPAPTTWSQPPQQSTISTPISAGPPSTLPPSGVLQDPYRQLSPHPISSAGNSPVNAGYQGQSQSRLSPSYFLQQRQSPYRPVRRVQTLLYPPPSASMQAPTRNISHDQMQYQPLGRPQSERRAGNVPYMHYEAWPETNQFNQWPILPPPNFTRT